MKIWKLWMYEGGIWVAKAFNVGFMKVMKKNMNLMIYG